MADRTEREKLADAVMFILVRDGRVLMERCPKKGALHGAEWFIPGGRIEEGEGEWEALQREMKEELGVFPSFAHRVGIVDGTAPRADRAFLMQAMHVTEWQGQVPDRTLDHGYDLRWAPISEALRSPLAVVRSALAAADLLSEEGEPVAWLVVEPGSALKRCPECGAVALEGQADCSECGAHPLDDRSWRIAGRMPRFGHPGPVQEAAP